MTRLHGKTAFVSGGTRGIGLAIASRLAREGAHVMIVGSSQANCESAAASIAAQAPGGVEAHAADLSTLEGCHVAFEAHQQIFGRCDILIHSAGALKFHAGVRLSRLFWPSLVESRGHVVMIVGGASRTPDAKFMVGGAVNAALANFAKALAGQGLQDDVNVNWINPGQTETERLQELLATRARDEGVTIDEVRAERMKAEGIRRLGQPEDTAALVAFLCGDEARHIHGAGIGVDGGATKGYF